MDQSAIIDYVESFITSATVEVMNALDRGANGENLDSALVFLRNTVFIEAASLTRSVDAAESAVKRFDAKTATIQFCEKCERNRINGQCVTCLAVSDKAFLVHGE